MSKQAKQAWRILLHAHDSCRSADAQMLIHRLMVKVVEDDWRETSKSNTPASDQPGTKGEKL